jgi:hypothetical protein
MREKCEWIVAKTSDNFIKMATTPTKSGGKENKAQTTLSQSGQDLPTKTMTNKCRMIKF